VLQFGIIYLVLANSQKNRTLEQQTSPAAYLKKILIFMVSVKPKMAVKLE